MILGSFDNWLLWGKARISIKRGDWTKETYKITFSTKAFFFSFFFLPLLEKFILGLEGCCVSFNLLKKKTKQKTEQSDN